jgi:hypothetical protein
MQGPEATGALREPVIIPPAPEVKVQIVDNLMNRLSAVAVCQFTYPVLESFYRYRMDTDTRVTSLAGETEPGKAHPPGMSDSALHLVHLQSQLLDDKA